MKYLHPVGVIPNALILDENLDYTSKKVAVVLQLLAGRKNRDVKVSFKDLARLAHVSAGTAKKAVDKLQDRGYLSINRRYRYSDELNHLIYAANSYTLVCQEGGYTLIRKEILGYNLTPAAFAVLLYLYCLARRQSKAFPSLRRIAGLRKEPGLGMAKSTVCKVLTALRRLQAFVRLMCRTKRGFFASNSYYLTDCVVCGKGNDQTESRKGFSVCGEGGPIFDKPNINKQITEGYNWSREKKVSDNSAFCINSGWKNIWCEQYYFDGTGVKVFPGEEDYAITA